MTRCSPLMGGWLQHGASWHFPSSSRTESAGPVPITDRPCSKGRKPPLLSKRGSAFVKRPALRPGKTREFTEPVQKDVRVEKDHRFPPSKASHSAGSRTGPSMSPRIFTVPRRLRCGRSRSNGFAHGDSRAAIPRAARMPLAHAAVIPRLVPAPSPTIQIPGAAWKESSMNRGLFPYSLISG